MKLGKTSSVEQLQIISRFEALRRTLLSDMYADLLQKPLAYWALPNDRRLPLAFLGRTLRELLTTPFAELAATPGVGQKKMCSFVHLLARAAHTDPSQIPAELPESLEALAGAPSDKRQAGENGFDPLSVSEVMWSQWRASVIQHGLGQETLGRLAPSLRNVTRVIWNTPLSAYTGLTLADIRGLKTHGDKRLCAILEVFYGVHALTANMGPQKHLLVRLVPRLIDRVEQWIGQTLQTPGIPDAQELLTSFIRPLLEQVRIDASQQIASLAEVRLGISGPLSSVRQASRSMGLTRARVYQLLNEINDIMMVRWPNGRHQVYELYEKFRREAAELGHAPDMAQFHAAVELFYPGSRRGAAGPLEHAAVTDEDDIALDGEEIEADGSPFELRRSEACSL